jgi:hypothetical protein
MPQNHCDRYRCCFRVYPYLKDTMRSIRILALTPVSPNPTQQVSATCMKLKSGPPFIFEVTARDPSVAA